MTIVWLLIFCLLLSQQVVVLISDDCTLEELLNSLAVTYSQISEASILEVVSKFEQGSNTYYEISGCVGAVADQLVIAEDTISERKNCNKH